MGDYTLVTCSTCRQDIYLAKYRLQARAWYCPSCKATNVSAESTRYAPKGPAPSRFAAQHPTTTTQ